MKRLLWIVALSIGATVLVGGVFGAPANADDDYGQGMKKVAAEDWPAALDLLEKAVLAEPDDLRIGTDYRQAVIAAGEYDRCLAFFAKLVADNPEAPNALMNLGYAHVDKIPVEGAITAVILANTALTHFTKALEMEETWLGRYTRGNSYLYWPAIFGRTQLGIDDLERAIEMAESTKKRPYHGRAWAALGDGYWRLENAEKAAEIWRQGLEMYPDNQEIQDRLAAVEGGELDAYLGALFETSNRVGTHLREIWAAHEDDEAEGEAVAKVDAGAGADE